MNADRRPKVSGVLAVYGLAVSFVLQIFPNPGRESRRKHSALAGQVGLSVGGLGFRGLGLTVRETFGVG